MKRQGHRERSGRAELAASTSVSICVRPCRKDPPPGPSLFLESGGYARERGFGREQVSPTQFHTLAVLNLEGICVDALVFAVQPIGVASAFCISLE
eukprot:453709-Pelagomonas_calceolata.AAC.1